MTLGSPPASQTLVPEGNERVVELCGSTTNVHTNLEIFFIIVKLHDWSHPEVDLYIAIEGIVVDVEGQLELSFFLDVGRLKQSQTI